MTLLRGDPPYASGLCVSASAALLPNDSISSASPPVTTVSVPAPGVTLSLPLSPLFLSAGVHYCPFCSFWVPQGHSSVAQLQRSLGDPITAPCPPTATIPTRTHLQGHVIPGCETTWSRATLEHDDCSGSVEWGPVIDTEASGDQFQINWKLPELPTATPPQPTDTTRH